jgi:hypothetical protein
MVVRSKLLGGWAYDKNAKWCKGAVATSWEGEFPRGWPPNNMVEVEAEGNIC